MAAMGTTSCVIQEPAEVYHQKASDYLSSHALADFRRCPLLYFKKKQRMIAEGDRTSYLIGRAAHTLILEGKQQFDAEYGVGKPINPATGKPFGQTTKAFIEWAEKLGKPVLTEEQFELIRNMAVGVCLSDAATEILDDGIAEGVVRTDYCGMPCQIRMDWFAVDRGIADLKTCDDLTWFESDARRYGYAHQMAFYRAVLQQVIGISMPAFLIAVEKKEPFRCGVWRLSHDTLAVAQKENEAAIERLKKCAESGDWPTGFEQPRVLDYI